MPRHDIISAPAPLHHPPQSRQLYRVRMPDVPSRSELIILLLYFLRSQKSEASHKGSFEEKDAQCEPDECDEPRDLNRETNVARAQHGPQRDRKYHDRQQNQDERRPNRRNTTGSAPHEQPENCSGDRADHKLAGNCRANAQLLEMIVTSDLAHERKKGSRRNEDRKAIADDDERRGHAE